MGKEPRQCFGCGNDVYFTRAVQKPDGKGPAPLDQYFDEEMESRGMEPVYHNCQGKAKPRNNYEANTASGNQWADRSDTTTTNKPSTQKTNLAVTTKEDLDYIKEKLGKIEELVEAAMKGNLFQNASTLDTRTHEKPEAGTLAKMGASNYNKQQDISNKIPDPPNEEVVGDDEDGTVVKNDGEEVVI